MKIIYLHQYFNTPAMPGGTRSYEFAKNLIKMGHEDRNDYDLSRTVQKRKMVYN